MITIAICDDELVQLNKIKTKTIEVFERKSEEYTIYEYHTGKTILDDAANMKFDIVLLDIDMPEENGIDVAEELALINPRSNIVFVTNRADLVFEAIRCQPYRFIRKSRLDEEMEEAISTLIDKILNETYVVTFSDKQVQYSFHILDIIYIESKKHYLYFYVGDEEYRCRMRIGDCVNKLKEYGFIKIHGSILVNVRYVKKVTSKEISLTNGTILPISRSNAEAVKLRYLEEMEKHVNGIVL
ncbi:MAG: response regulator transcription factor [Lachnospiraceae bacterium]|nr:response regulator transcription factor [Lachnospiraceae bacterium]